MSSLEKNAKRPSGDKFAAVMKPFVMEAKKVRAKELQSRLFAICLYSLNCAPGHKQTAETVYEGRGGIWCTAQFIRGKPEQSSDRGVFWNSIGLLRLAGRSTMTQTQLAFWLEPAGNVHELTQPNVENGPVSRRERSC